NKRGRFQPSLRGAQRRSNPSFLRLNGLLRFARNDGGLIEANDNNKGKIHERYGPAKARFRAAHHHHEPSRSAQRAQSGYDARSGRGGTARGGGSRGPRRSS